MKPRKILLLNPPGNRLYLRDYYCSKISKGRYINHPVDLLILSGILNKRHEVKVLDAMALRLSGEETLKKIISLDIDTIIFITGSVSWKEDFKFMKRVKENKKVTLMASGDILLENGAKRLTENEFLNAILLDFTSDAILNYLEDGSQRIDNIIFRKGKRILEGKEVRKHNVEFEIPIPRHELFNRKLYCYPFTRKPYFATVLTDYGCPFKCSFCIAGTLGFKTRRVANVIEELKYIQSLGIKEIYFADQTFGTDRKRTQELLKQMIRERLNFGWVCFSRVDLIDEDLLKLMKESGCHTIMLGVESTNDEILRKYQKGITRAQIVSAFKLCRGNRMRTVGIFIIGLPGEDEESTLKTIRFAQELRCDYASFNIATPRFGTEFRKEALLHHWTSPQVETMGQSSTYPVIRTDELSSRKIWELRNKAIRKFYLRPSYLLRRLLNIRSPYEFKIHMQEGWALLKSIYSRTR